MKNSIKVITTPESAFENLKDYPFAQNYMDVGGLNMHYVDEGDKSSKVIFLFHGQPTWSYLYRHMIPMFVKAGYRVIAPDLIGFGKSDKPINAKDISYTSQVNWMKTFVQKLGIEDASAFMQDWGGMIGLRVLADNPKWLKRLIVANTALSEVKGITRFIMPKMLKLMTLFTGKSTIDDFEKKQNYGNWASYFIHADKPEIGDLVQILTTSNLSRDELDAYDAPFRGNEYFAAPRKMPLIVGQDLKEAYEDWQKLKRWEHPVLTLFSDKDPFLADQGYDKLFQTNFKGAAGQPHITISNASHFLQEDKPKELVGNILNWLDKTNF